MNILVTGGCGMIGSRVVAAIPGAIAYDIARDPTEDVTRRDYLGGAPDALDGIIHLAGVSRLSAGHDAPYACVAANILGALHTLEIAQQYGAWAILGSTREVRTGRRPQSMYEVTKHTAELLGERYAQDYNGRVLALRFSDVYGADPPDSTRMLPTMIREARDKGYVRASTSPHIYCPTHIDDTVDAILAGVKWITDAPGGSYAYATICGSRMFTPRTLAELIHTIVGPSLATVSLPMTPLDHVRSGSMPSNLLAHQLLDWRPTREFQPWLKQQFAPACNHAWTHPDNNTRRCVTCGRTEPYECYGAEGMPFQP